MLPVLVLMMMGAGPAMMGAVPAPPGFIAPAAIGVPHACVENTYPISALQTGTEGSTDLAFTITPQGSVTGVSVAGSSGNPDLDTASVACVGNWMYRPATKDGVAVESLWRAKVVWRINVTGLFEDIDHASYRCLIADDAMHDKVRQTALHTVIRVHFAKGTFANVAIAASSGDPDLDNYVQACYANMSPGLAADIPDGTDELFVAMLPPGG